METKEIISFITDTIDDLKFLVRKLSEKIDKQNDIESQIIIDFTLDKSRIKKAIVKSRKNLIFWLKKNGYTNDFNNFLKDSNYPSFDRKMFEFCEKEIELKSFDVENKLFVDSNDWCWRPEWLREIFDRELECKDIESPMFTDFCMPCTISGKEILKENKDLDFGDFVLIKQHSYYSDNKMYLYMVIEQSESSIWVEVPVGICAKEVIHKKIEKVVSCVCFSVKETKILRYRVTDVIRKIIRGKRVNELER